MSVIGPITIGPGEYKHLENITIDGGGAAVAVKVLKGGRIRLTDCPISNATAYLVDVEDGGRAIVDGCKLSNTMHGIRFKGTARGRVIGCEFSDWLHYACHVQGTKEAGPKNVTIDDNEFSDPKPGTDKNGKAARQSVFAGNPDRVCNIIGLRVTNNRIYGPLEYHNPSDPKSRGTGDQIVLHYCKDFIVAGNTSSGGGENGISITLDSNTGIVSKNIVRDCDGHGIQIGSKNENADEPAAWDIVVSDNVCANNGRGVDPNAQKTIAGIYIQDARRITISGNQITDSNVGQKYGILVAISDWVSISADNNISGTKDTFEPVRIFQTHTMHVTAHWGIHLPAIIASSADKIIEVVGDDATIESLKVLGQFHANTRQIGIFSETAKRGRILNCSFDGVPTCIKLDLQATHWTMSDLNFDNVYGTEAGFGYCVILGSGYHTLRRLRGVGKPGRGRHLLYLTDGAEFCYAYDLIGDGFAHALIAMHSRTKLCVGNVVELVTALNQGIGGMDSGAIEVDGLFRRTVIRKAYISNIGRHGIVVNTLGLLHDSDTVIDTVQIDGTGENGIFVKGAKGVQLLNVDIKNVSRSKPGSFSCVDLEAWPGKHPAQDITIVGKLDAKGAREPLTLNPTPPKPTNVRLNGSLIAA